MAQERLPRRGHTNVAVPIAVVPVVDVEPVVVEVPDVHTVAVRVDERCPFPSETPEIEVYYQILGLYLLSPVFDSRAVHKEHLHQKGARSISSLKLHTTAIHRRRYSGTT